MDSLKKSISAYRDDFDAKEEAAKEKKLKEEMEKDKAIADAMNDNDGGDTAMQVDQKEEETGPKLRRQSNPRKEMGMGMD